MRQSDRDNETIKREIEARRLWEQSKRQTAQVEIKSVTRGKPSTDPFAEWAERSESYWKKIWRKARDRCSLYRRRNRKNRNV